AGRIDQASARTVTIRVTGTAASLEELGELVVATRAGATIRLRDVAVIEEVIEEVSEEVSEAVSAGGPGGRGGPLLIGVRLQRGAGREEVLVVGRSAIAELRGALPPRLELVERPPPPRQRARPPLVAGLRGPDRAVLRTIAVKLEAELRASN